MSDESAADGAATSAGETGAEGGATESEGRATETDGRATETEEGDRLVGESAAIESIDTEDDELASWISDDGIILFFAAIACLLAATTANITGQPTPVVALAVVAGGSAAVAFAVDVFTDYVAGTPLELFVGGAALAAGLFAVPGRHYVNIGTLLAAAALVLWRVYDVEYRDAER